MPHCGWGAAEKKKSRGDALTANPSMFRSNPIGFICSVILIAAGVGLIILVHRWLKCKMRTITITNKRTRCGRG